MEFFKEGDEDINLSGLSSEFLKTVIVKKYISLDKANRLLRERGRVVRTNPKYISPGHWAPIFSDGDTHQALLICIEPITDKQTAVLIRAQREFEETKAKCERLEKVLRIIASQTANGSAPYLYLGANGMAELARQALEGK